MTEQVEKYVVFDTEGNGLFEFKDPVTKEPIPADAPGQPRLASIAFVFCDAEGVAMRRDRYYIKPDGWSIHDQDQKSRDAGRITASQVNGLTDEFLTENGVPVQEVLDIWHSIIDRGLIAAAYNAQHDCKQIRAELRRAGMDDRFEETRNTCLMRAMKAYKEQGLALGRGGWVKLAVACEFFGFTGFDWHNAEDDTDAAVMIMQRMIRDGTLIEPKVHYAAGHNDA